jgi:hypothetical protein
LNLNIHFHTQLFDGVFHAAGEGVTLDFRPLPPPTDDEVGVVLARITARVPRCIGGWRRRELSGGRSGTSHKGLNVSFARPRS